MPIEFTCDHCRQLVQTPDSAAGKKGRCPFCQAVVHIPLRTGAAVTVEPAARPAPKPAAPAPSPNEPLVVTCPGCRQQMAGTRSMIGQILPCPYCRTAITVAGGPISAAPPSQPLRSIFDEAPLPKHVEELPSEPVKQVPTQLRMYTEMLRQAVGTQQKSTPVGRALCMIAGILALCDACIWLIMGLKAGGIILMLLSQKNVASFTFKDWESFGTELAIYCLGPLVPGVLASFSGYYLIARQSWILAVITAVLTVIIRFALQDEISAMVMVMIWIQGQALIPLTFREPIYITWLLVTIIEFFIVVMPVTRQEFPELTKLEAS